VERRRAGAFEIADAPTHSWRYGLLSHAAPQLSFWAVGCPETEMRPAQASFPQAHLFTIRSPRHEAKRSPGRSELAGHRE
jgi:hypothetical protein